MQKSWKCLVGPVKRLAAGCRLLQERISKDATVTLLVCTENKWMPSSRWVVYPYCFKRRGYTEEVRKKKWRHIKQRATDIPTCWALSWGVCSRRTARFLI